MTAHRNETRIKSTMTDSDIPLVYGTPIPPPTGANPAASAPIVDTSGRPNLQSATRLNGGRSSRFTLPTDNENVEITERTIQSLMDQGFTRGLAESLRRNKMAFPLSIWIVDNSGSMQHQDGHRILEIQKKKQLKLVPCTRWAEMQQTVEYHALMAAKLQSPTIFR